VKRGYEKQAMQEHGQTIQDWQGKVWKPRIPVFFLQLPIQSGRCKNLSPPAIIANTEAVNFLPILFA